MNEMRRRIDPSSLEADPRKYRSHRVVLDPNRVDDLYRGAKVGSGVTAYSPLQLHDSITGVDHGRSKDDPPDPVETAAFGKDSGTANKRASYAHRALGGDPILRYGLSNFKGYAGLFDKGSIVVAGIRGSCRMPKVGYRSGLAAVRLGNTATARRYNDASKRAARWLADAGGSEPTMDYIPRRRFETPG